MKKIIKKIKTHFILPSLGFAVLFWIFDIIVDVYIFKEGTIKEHLWSPEPFEIYYRSFVVLLFVAFGFIGQRMSEKRKTIEATLRLTEDKYKIVADNTYDWEFWTGEDRKFIYTSPASYRITGYPPQNFEADPELLDSIIHPDDIAQYNRHRDEAEKEHGLHEVEFRIRHTDKSIRWISHACQPVIGPNGEFLGIRGTNRDITARKTAEMDLTEKEAKYRGLFEGMLNGFALHKIITGENGRPVDYEFIEVNDTFKRMTGLIDKEIVGRRVTEVIPEINDDDFDWIGTYGRVAQNNERIQFEQYSKALGKWYNISAYSNEKGYFVTVFEDITERKKIESVLHENQERTEAIFGAVQAGIVVIDKETHIITYANKQASKMIGAPVNDIVDRKCNKFICPANDGMCPITDLNQEVDNSEKCVINVVGENIPILKTVTQTKLDGRDVLVESFVDISDRKKMENELQFRNILLTTQQEASIDGILVVDENAKIVSYNHRFVKMWGIPSDLIKQNDDRPLLEFVASKIMDMEAFMARVKYLYEHRKETSRDEIILKDSRVFDRYSAPMTGSDEQYYGRVWYFRDITEHKEQEKMIKEQALFFESLIETILNPVFYKDKEGKYLGCNKAFEKMLGIPKDQIVGKTVYDLSPQEKAEQYHKKDMELLREGGIQTYEYEVKTAEHGLREMQFNKSIFKDASGNPLGIVGVMVDITEIKRTEQTLREKIDTLGAITNSAQDAIIMMDSEGKVIFWNPASERILGYPSQEALGKSLHRLIAPEEFLPKHQMAFPEFQKTGRGGAVDKMLELRAVRKDGKEIDVELSLSAIKIGDSWNAVGLIRDITQRLENERVLRESENLHRSLFEAAGRAGEAIILMQDNEDALVACIISNEEAHRITGYTGEELKKISWLDLIHPDFKKVANERARRRLNNELLPSVYNVTIINKAGQNVPIEIVGSRIEYNGRPALVGYFRDITERQKAETEIRKLNTALDQSSSIVVITDINGSIEYVNKAFTALTGYSAEEAIGKNPRILKSGDKSSEEYRRLWQTISSGKEWTGEFHNRKKNGELYWEQAYITAIRDEQGRITHYMAVKSDITERKQSEALQAAIYKISEISVSSENLPELYAGIHMVIDELMNTANFYIAVYNTNDELLEFPYFVDEKDPRPIPRPLKKGLTEYVLRTGSSLMAPPMVQNKLVQAGEVEMVGTPSIDWVGVPLKSGKDTFGAIVVQSYREQVRFGARELSMLNFVSDNIAAAIMRKKAEDERKKLVKELQESLNNIKTLKGLIPICSNCKKIRNDSGYWQQLEVYVSEHSGADFSHGLCDECAHELYPQYFKNKKNRTQGDEVG